jgi:hypothetical protein
MNLNRLKGILPNLFQSAAKGGNVVENTLENAIKSMRESLAEESKLLDELHASGKMPKEQYDLVSAKLSERASNFISNPREYIESLQPPKESVIEQARGGLRNNWGKIVAGTVGVGAFLSAVGGVIPRDQMITRTLFDRTIGLIADPDKSDKTGFTGSMEIRRMEDSAEHAKEVLDSALGINIQMHASENRFKDGELERIAKHITEKGLTGANFYDSGDIIEQYLKTRWASDPSKSLVEAAREYMVRIPANEANELEKTTEVEKQGAALAQQTRDALVQQQREGVIDGFKQQGGLSGYESLAPPAP